MSSEDSVQMKRPAGKKRQKRSAETPAIAALAREPWYRMAYIVGLMVRELWERGGPQIELLAKEWGVSVKTVRADAVEAGRMLKVFYRDADKIERYCQVRLHEIAEENGPDRVAAITVRLKNLGRLNDKLEVNLSAVPTRELVKQNLPTILADPELRALFLEELDRYGDATEERRGLLTTGEEVK